MTVSDKNEQKKLANKLREICDPNNNNKTVAFLFLWSSYYYVNLFHLK